MIVQDLGQHLREVGSARIDELARRFTTSEDAIEAMMCVWMRKGCVKKIHSGGCSGRCCGLAEQTRFTWIKDDHQIAIVQL